MKSRFEPDPSLKISIEAVPGGKIERRSPYESMNFSDLEADSVAGPILQEMALEHLRTSADFLVDFSTELDSRGCLKYLSGESSNLKPSQNISAGAPMTKVAERTKSELKRLGK